MSTRIKDRIKLVTEYSEQLIRIYKKLDNQDDYKEELIFYVFNCENYDISYVMELKNVNVTIEMLENSEIRM